MNTRQDAAVIPADPVLDGELIEDDDRPGGQWQQSRRVVSWWQRSPRIPATLKNRAHALQSAKDAAVTVICAPWRFVGAAGRGTVLAVRAWRRWVTVFDYREAAEQSEKLADKYVEIRELTLFRWRVTGAVAGTTTAGVAVADMLYGDLALWITGLIGAAVLAITGRHQDGSPGRRAVLAGPRSLSWTMDPQILLDAFRDAKLIGKDETLRLVQRAHRVGAGWAITVDLPATRKATDVIKNREALASALAVDEVQLLIERVRGNGGHAGRVAMWVADTDPYATPPTATPLLEVACWDAWRPVPFGRDARDRRISLPLVWTSLLVGAI
ncbi:MAG: cell division protein FtsK, partial [Pseudonocardiaceae bacterium]